MMLSTYLCSSIRAYIYRITYFYKEKYDGMVQERLAKIMVWFTTMFGLDIGMMTDQFWFQNHLVFVAARCIYISSGSKAPTVISTSLHC